MKTISPMPSTLDAMLIYQEGKNILLPHELEKARFNALRQTLYRAFTFSNWYREKLKGFDLNINSEEDLQKLPFTSPNDLREDYRKFLCISQGDTKRIVTLPTSGSSASPKRIAFSDNDLERTKVFFSFGLSQLAKPGQRLMVLLPGAQRPDGVSDLIKQALRPLNIDVVAGDPSATALTLRSDLQKWKPQVIVVAPHQLQTLLAEAKKDLTFRKLASVIDGIQSSGDILDNILRNELEDLLGCIVLDHYGMTETCFGGGVECMVRHGYHMRELDLFIEIIDPMSNKPVQAGIAGEIVLTTLNREAMPLIRYRTGDSATWIDAPCPCGSKLRRLSPLLGRYILENGTPVLRRIHKGGFNATDS